MQFIHHFILQLFDQLVKKAVQYKICISKDLQITVLTVQ